MHKLLYVLALIILTGCAGQKSASTTKEQAGTGNVQSEDVQLLNDVTYRLTATTNDKTYGYTEKNPIKVGGINNNTGPKNERRFLNALTGPNGETVSYYRAGSCCHFKTSKGINNTGLLDRYRVTWKNSPDTVNIYMNMYDKGNLLIPVGFKAKR